jgi:hypothetical protein
MENIPWISAGYEIKAINTNNGISVKMLQIKTLAFQGAEE